MKTYAASGFAGMLVLARSIRPASAYPLTRLSIRLCMVKDLGGQAMANFVSLPKFGHDLVAHSTMR